MKVFITGASSGIGEALAHEYAQRYRGEGVAIGLAARRADALTALKDTLQRQYAIDCKIYPLDVRHSNALSLAAADFIAQFGVPDVVIANAGVSSGTLTENMEDTAAFQIVFDINVLGMVHTFQPFIQAMREAGSTGRRAHLVGIASVAGIRGLPGAGAYSASKAAAIAYLESLRVEMLHHGIAVTTIAPGYIRTPMTAINPYRMPFLMEANIAAHKFVNAIEAKRRFVVIPWQMGWVARLMRLIPPVLWDCLAKNAPHKSRVHLD
ncbi:MAG: short-chain dehydrogenase [Betaproteobacteria bacterium HGW-Betaproteobacteria-22]|nr:MAG: short-chain dehydrogenase [Betaproteobacteria bacterium HGW-Betaproteobacteria-22]